MANIDANLENADWTKQTWDLPPETPGEMLEYLAGVGVTPSHFSGLPAALAAPWLQEPVVAAAVDHSLSTMIALYPQGHEADALARPGGQRAKDLHVTLAYLPDGITVDRDELAISLYTLAEMTNTMVGEVGGLGVFKEGEDGRPLVALPDVVGLNEFRADVVGLLDLMGQGYAQEHGFLPHITLEYIGDDIIEGERQEGIPLTFTAVTLVRGLDQIDYLFKTQVLEEDES